jgi:hypothetical protein
MAVRMTWVIHIPRGTMRFEYAAEELRAALAVASLLLRDSIEVERIDDPDGQQFGVDVIRELTGLMASSAKRHVARRLG